MNRVSTKPGADFGNSAHSIAQFLWLLIGLLIIAESCSAQTADVCPCGNDDPTQYAVKIVMDPPLKLPTASVFRVPNQITVYVPIGLHASRIELWSGLTGTETTKTFKRFAQTKESQRTGRYDRFQISVDKCPGSDNAFQLGIYAAELDHPLSVNIQPFTCKAQAAP
jgi:hypothetical protein